MYGRLQRTIRNCVETTGIGFLTGKEVTVRFRPAELHCGIQFRRTDCPDSAPIPARIEYAVSRRGGLFERRTTIARDGVTVEMIEHVMAALAGLQIDNCTVELNGPELPGFDGSALKFAESIISAGIVDQPEARRLIVVQGSVVADEPGAIGDSGDKPEILYRSTSRPVLAITYHLDYGPHSPIGRQEYSLEITPESFLRELAFARTFLLEKEAQALRAAGYGRRTSYRDLLVFGPDGPVSNTLRVHDECARHKVLDCLGDFALMGGEIHGQFMARRSGHYLNRELVRRLIARASTHDATRAGKAA